MEHYMHALMLYIGKGTGGKNLAQSNFIRMCGRHCLQQNYRRSKTRKISRQNCHFRNYENNAPAHDVRSETAAKIKNPRASSRGEELFNAIGNQLIEDSIALLVPTVKAFNVLFYST